MKFAALSLAFLALLSCEKRVADSELEAVRAWLLSDQGHKNTVEELEASRQNITIARLTPRENWVIKRFTYSTSAHGNRFLICGKEMKTDKWWANIGDLRASGFDGFRRRGFFYLDQSEFENLGDLVAWKDIMEAKRRSSRLRPKLKRIFGRRSKHPEYQK